MQTPHHAADDVLNGTSNGMGSSAKLSINSIDPRVMAAEYAVRGEIVKRATVIAQELELERQQRGLNAGPAGTEVEHSAGSSAAEDGSSHGAMQHRPKRKRPFDKVIWVNIGNPQILGQPPVTFFRQVLCLCEYPQLLDSPQAVALFPSDVIARARLYLDNIPGGLGAYSDSAGALVLRQHIAAAIEARDWWPCDAEDLFMTDGASPAVHYMMNLLLRNDKDAFLVPIPQYPLYSATLTLYGGQLVPYLLDESQGWALDVGHLRQQLAHAHTQGLCIRGLVVINPGNPTGQCLSRANQAEVLAFCEEHDLVLIADEVYQTNIYAKDKTFSSFKAVLRETNCTAPLVSLHSTSKGFVGECGRRGGYMEVVNFPEDVRDQILKLASINLCPNVSGQICCALMMTPPMPGEPSYELYASEREGILESLARRAAMLVAGLNALEGVTCNDAEGALYAFPRITLPTAAVAEAERMSKQPDWLYCAELLEETGIVVVPGSGFGQKDGTWHFRTTFLPPEEDMGEVVLRLSNFHAQFLARYGGLSKQHAQSIPEK